MPQHFNMFLSSINGDVISLSALPINAFIATTKKGHSRRDNEIYYCHEYMERISIENWLRLYGLKLIKYFCLL